MGQKESLDGSSILGYDDMRKDMSIVSIYVYSYDTQGLGYVSTS